ncbi:hypothetical protein FKW77_004775 [Venturia effusa]|uniref:Lipocalin n=1 Tax=Venturia effusa TaxID=50376 RepID=A0A517L976_9PEZI|nr:hypothetical protein FKW77_004775 [Venturia effusa]
MLPTLSKYMAIVLCMTSIVHADYWKFTIDKIQCIEPREWKTDHLYLRINMVTRGRDGKVKQNQTTDTLPGGSLEFPRGFTSGNGLLLQKMNLDDGDTDLLVTYTAWNKGDKELQKIGITIAELVLSVLGGNLAVAVITTAIGLVLDKFKDAYDCHGPAVLAVVPYSQADLRSMQYGQPRCETGQYTFKTGPGCVNNQPFNLKSKLSNYTASYCLQRYPGSTTTIA